MPFNFQKLLRLSGTMLVPLGVEQGLDSQIFDNRTLTYWRAEGEMHTRLEQILDSASVGYVAQSLRISRFSCAARPAPPPCAVLVFSDPHSIPSCRFLCLSAARPFSSVV